MHNSFLKKEQGALTGVSNSHQWAIHR